jgi:hypothetical protein
VSNANAVAAARVDTLIFVKMFDRCRATVLSLRNKLRRDLFVRVTGRHEAEHLGFALGQPRR